jgi:L-alanine-DL-glutamate epimerase-like enolase superfamily enzyme
MGPHRKGCGPTAVQTLGRGEKSRTGLYQHDPAFDDCGASPDGAPTEITGWKAIKLRAHYQTLKEDVRLVEAVRKAVGDEMEIMVDADQAQSFGT